jgi:hypothetical protein
VDARRAASACVRRLRFKRPHSGTFVTGSLPDPLAFASCDYLRSHALARAG